MRKFIHRLKLLFLKRKIMDRRFLHQLTMMDIGRWFFRQAHICHICGSLNVIGCGKGGLYCSQCERRQDHETLPD